MTRETDDATSEDRKNPTPTRRRTMLALGGAMLGAAGYGYGLVPDHNQPPAASLDDTENPVAPTHVATLAALAEAIYPSGVDVDRDFIERQVVNRTEPQPGHFEELVATVESVDDHARARFGNPITDLPPGRRRQVLRSMGVTTVHPTPDGTIAEQVRYYLVNDLLYALFTSPASSHLTGIENPPGHPGGRDAYQRGSDST